MVYGSALADNAERVIAMDPSITGINVHELTSSSRPLRCRGFDFLERGDTKRGNVVAANRVDDSIDR